MKLKIENHTVNQWNKKLAVWKKNPQNQQIFSKTDKKEREREREKRKDINYRFQDETGNINTGKYQKDEGILSKFNTHKFNNFDEIE